MFVVLCSLALGSTQSLVLLPSKIGPRTGRVKSRHRETRVERGMVLQRGDHLFASGLLSSVCFPSEL